MLMLFLGCQAGFLLGIPLEPFINYVDKQARVRGVSHMLTVMHKLGNLVNIELPKYLKSCHRSLRMAPFLVFSKVRKICDTLAVIA